MWTAVEPPAERDKVLVGRDGWLFLQHDRNDVVGQHTGRVRPGRQWRRAWKDVLRSRLAAISELGPVWICQICPDKESVYPEYLPADITPAARRPVHDLLDISRALRAPVGYPLDELSAAKPNGPLYHKTDTHWNHRGALVAYRALCRALVRRGIEPVPFQESALRWFSRVRPHDLGGKLDPPVSSEALLAYLDQHGSQLRFDNRIHNHGHVIIFERSDGSGPSCVVFGESFVEQILLFLKESFRRLVFIHTNMLIPEVIEAEAPDVVISLPLERFLLQVPDDAGALAKLRSTAIVKLARGKTRQMPYPHGCLDLQTEAFEQQLGVVPW